MPRLKESTRIARREQLMQAAGRCFARHGVARTTMADLLAEAGVSAGAAYAHFKSKEDLVVAIARSSSARDQAKFAACCRPGDRAGTITAILDLAFADWRAPGARVDVRVDVGWWSEAVTIPGVAAALRDAVAGTHAALATVLARASERRVTGVDRDAARTLAALLLGLMVQWHLDARLDPFGVEKAIRHAAAALAVPPAPHRPSSPRRPQPRRS